MPGEPAAEEVGDRRAGGIVIDDGPRRVTSARSTASASASASRAAASRRATASRAASRPSGSLAMSRPREPAAIRVPPAPRVAFRRLERVDSDEVGFGLSALAGDRRVEVGELALPGRERSRRRGRRSASEIARGGPRHPTPPLARAPSTRRARPLVGASPAASAASARRAASTGALNASAAVARASSQPSRRDRLGSALELVERRPRPPRDAPDPRAAGAPCVRGLGLAVRRRRHPLSAPSVSTR